MKWAALVIGMFLTCVGLVGLAVPMALFEVARTGQSAPWIYLAAAVRVLIGVVLYFAAPRSRLPLVMAVLGTVIFMAGVLTPLAGSGAAILILDSWSVLGPVVVRLFGILALLIGGVVIYATLPPLWGEVLDTGPHSKLNSDPGPRSRFK